MNFRTKIATSTSIFIFGSMLTTNLFAMEHDEDKFNKGRMPTAKSAGSSSSVHIPPLDEQFSKAVGNVFVEIGLDKDLGQVIYSLRPEVDFQCNGALKGAKGGNRVELFNKLKEGIEKVDIISEVSISDKGHINIFAKDEVLASYANYMLHDGKLGVHPNKPVQKVVLDYGGPNVAKSMHVGHLRSSVVGDALKRILRFMGDEVIGDIHLGDWGLHIGMVINGIKKTHPDLPYFKENYDKSIPCGPVVTIKDLEEIYPREAALCKADKNDTEARQQAAKDERQQARDITARLQEGHPGYTALWEHIVDVSVTDLKKNYQKLGIGFDLWLGESSVNDRIPQIVKRANEKGITIVKDGATVIPVKEKGDKTDMPDVVLVKSNGGYTYQTTDIATIEDRIQKINPTWILYVVDQRQGLHFQQVFRAVRKLGLVGENVQLDHAGFGTINGKDGKPFKTRSGDVVKLEDLITMSRDSALKIIKNRSASTDIDEEKTHFEEDELNQIANYVGLSAVKFTDLSHERTSDYIFDMDKVTSFHGDTGPYILYTGVRIKSVLQNAGKLKEEEAEEKVAVPLEAEERKLILTLSHLPKALNQAYAERSPTRVAQYSLDTAKSFNQFYKACPVVDKKQGTVSTSRRALAKLTLKSLETTLDLLGIKIPERM